MNCTAKHFDEVIMATGAPGLNHIRRPQKARSLAEWFFVRQEPESETTRLVREYLLECDDKGYVDFSK